MKTIGYVRVSSDQQNLEQQKHLLLQYAQINKILINEFIEAEVSSQKNTQERKIDVLLNKLAPGDQLLVAELSRLGRNILETLNIINKLSQSNIVVIFVRQPELSTKGPYTELLYAIYGYFAQSEREYISLRTKQGLEALKATGKILGRPKHSKNKAPRVLDPYNQQILEYLSLKISLASIVKIINNQLAKPLTYCAYIYHIKHHKELSKLLIKNQENKS